MVSARSQSEASAAASSGHAAVDQLLAAAQEAQRQGDDARAVDRFRAVLDAGAEHPLALNALGMIALRRTDYAEAKTLFARAAAADPTAVALWMNLASAHRRLQDDEGEQAALERSLSVDQLNLVAQLRLAELHQRRGEEKQAAIRWSAVVQMAAGMADRPPAVEEAVERGQAFLRHHSEVLQGRVDRALGQKLQANGPSARRFNACVANNLRGRAIYHNQCSGLHFPFLPADEFFERHHFPWLDKLEASTAAIRSEAERLLASGAASVRPYVQQDPGTPRNLWSQLDNNLNWSACFLWDQGTRNDAVCALCPETAAALAAVPQNNIPGKAPTAFFSILKAGAHIPPHTGVTNTRAIVHLPLIVPQGCSFRVGGETRDWREGEAFAFDDTIEHEAWNRSDEDRVVLIFDVWNPHLSEAEQELLADYFNLVEQPSAA